jgi:hypothetical protein
MNVPSAKHPRWFQIVTGEASQQFDFLAANILLGRVQMLTDEQKTRAKYLEIAVQLRELMESFKHLPSARRDLVRLFGEEGLK